MGRLKLLVASLALLFLLPVAASAYTIVLLTGRSVEIPAEFSVTRAGITYEHSPGLYVTIQMSSIDIAATERANKEQPGSLLRRADARPGAAGAAAASSTSGKAQRRTLTDKELEPLRRRREASEAVYERRRADLGLPSVEEMRRQREEETRRINELAAQSYADKASSEGYWRARAEELRTAIAVNDSEISYLRSRLRETSSYPTVAFTTIAPFPFVVSVPGRPFGRRHPYAPRPFGPRGGSRPEPLAGGIRFGGGSTRGRVIFNPRGSYLGYGRSPYGRQGVGILPLPVYAPNGYDQSYEQSQIRARLQELEAERAGLQARWRLLEDEARRAGAPPGWLRP